MPAVTLRNIVRAEPGLDRVLSVKGIRFIRVPRCGDDLRPPMYFDVESVKRYQEKKCTSASSLTG